MSLPTMAMRCVLLALLLRMPGAAPAPAAASTPGPLAILAAVAGRVDVTPVGARAALRATFGRALARGDRVSVGTASSATVFFSDGNLIELGEKSVVTIGGHATPRPRGGELSSDIFAGVNRFVAGGSRETGLVGLTPLRGGAESHPLLLRPRRTNLTGGRPLLSWRAVPGATGYRVVVSSEAGELWRRELADTLLAYPDDAPPLAAGADAEWEVLALSGLTDLRHESTVVHVLTASDASAIAGALASIRSVAGSDAAASRYLAGSYLCARELYVEAAAEFEALAVVSHAAGAAHEALGNVYRAIGLTDRAADEYQRALELARQP